MRQIFKALIIFQVINRKLHHIQRTGKYTLLLMVSPNNWSMFKTNNKEIVCAGELNNWLEDNSFIDQWVVKLDLLQNLEKLYFLLFLLSGLLFSLECSPVGLSPPALPSKPCSLWSPATTSLLNLRACLSPFELNHWVQFLKPSCLPHYLLSASVSYFGFLTNCSSSVFTSYPQNQGFSTSAPMAFWAR